GCTVIAKPAEQTPLIAKALVGHLVEAGLPAGVLNLLTTSQPDPRVKARLADPRVAKISFTGSTEVGLMLQRHGGGLLKRVALELGGHAPAIVLPDADVDETVAGVVASKFRTSGQSCIATNRLYVHESLYERICAALVERVSRLRSGPGTSDGVDLGRLIDESALRKLEEQVADAVRLGAKVLTGGSRLTDGELGNGAFFSPTVLTDVSDSAVLAQQEIFGPVLPVYSYADEQ